MLVSPTISSVSQLVKEGIRGLEPVTVLAALPGIWNTGEIDPSLKMYTLPSAYTSSDINVLSPK